MSLITTCVYGLTYQLLNKSVIISLNNAFCCFLSEHSIQTSLDSHIFHVSYELLSIKYCVSSVSLVQIQITPHFLVEQMIIIEVIPNFNKNLIINVWKSIIYFCSFCKIFCFRSKISLVIYISISIHHCDVWI